MIPIRTDGPNMIYSSLLVLLVIHPNAGVMPTAKIKVSEINAQMIDTFHPHKHLLNDSFLFLRSPRSHLSKIGGIDLWEGALQDECCGGRGHPVRTSLDICFSPFLLIRQHPRHIGEAKTWEACKHIDFWVCFPSIWFWLCLLGSHTQTQHTFNPSIHTVIFSCYF